MAFNMTPTPEVIYTQNPMVVGYFTGSMAFTICFIAALFVGAIIFLAVYFNGKARGGSI